MARQTQHYSCGQRARACQRPTDGMGRKASNHIQHIQLGKPQQNAYVERFNRTFRYEWLLQNYWQSEDEVQEFETHWMYQYNHQRSNMALGSITPKQRLAMVA